MCMIYVCVCMCVLQGSDIIYSVEELWSDFYNTLSLNVYESALKKTA